jgi:hypothetical protein
MPGTHRAADARSLCGHGCAKLHRSGACGAMDPGDTRRDDKKWGRPNTPCRSHHVRRFTMTRECEPAVRRKEARSCPRRSARSYAAGHPAPREGSPSAEASSRRGRVAGMLWANAVRSVGLKHRGRGATPRCPERAETAMLYAKSPARGGARPPSFSSWTARGLVPPRSPSHSSCPRADRLRG